MEAAANLLINKGCDVDTCTNEKNGQLEGDTPLIQACYYGMYDIVKKPVDNGAVINRIRKDKCSAVYLAACQGHLITLKFLLEKDASLADKKYGYNYMDITLLGIAAWNGHLEVVKYLLTNHKVNINQQEDDKSTALIIAAHFNHPYVVEYLLHQGANPSIRGVGNKTALEWSVESNNDKVTEVLKNEII